MELLKDILINLLSDGVSFVLGMLFVILFPFLKKPNVFKKLIQNTRNLIKVLMNFDCDIDSLQVLPVDIKKI